MVFQVGDTVRFLNEVGEGKILKDLGGNKFNVECDDGFDRVFGSKELVLSKKAEDYKLDSIEHNLSVKDKLQSENIAQKNLELDKRLARIRNEHLDFKEVDLHIEELIDSHRGMSNTQILNVQMANFKRELNSAIRTKLKRLIVIHGVGEGVLKSQISKELYDNYPELIMQDASYKDYGYGASEVILRPS